MMIYSFHAAHHRLFPNLPLKTHSLTLRSVPQTHICLNRIYRPSLCLNGISLLSSELIHEAVSHKNQQHY